MEKIYCIKCDKYKKLKNPKIQYIFDKTLVLSIICDRCGSNDENTFEKEESIEILKILGLVNDMNVWVIYIVPNKDIITLKKNMAEENISQEFILKKMDKARNYFIEEINQNYIMSKKHFNYIGHLLILASAVFWCVSISDFASLVNIPIRTAIFAVEL